jgi:transcriptional regulator with XRE-family HTH domain
VSRGEIGHLERTPPGPRTQASDRKPTLRTLVRLAAALGVDPSDLLALPDRQDLPPKDLLALRDEQARAHEEIADERELA